MLEEKQIIDIYKKNSRELFIYIFRFLGVHETAEDILHDCFANLIKYSGKHEIQEDSVRAFLYRTAHNLSVNYLKRKKTINFSSIDAGSDIISAEDIPSNLEYKELNKKINEFLEGVDGLSRSIFIMKKELNLGISEIAENTGKSERTVSRRLKQVMDYLSKALKDAGYIIIIILSMAFI